MIHASEVPIVDGHLDLAENVTLFGRDLTLDIASIRAREKRRANQATVSLPELRRGGIAVADLRKIDAIVPAGERVAVLGGNWLTFLKRALPHRT